MLTRRHFLATSAAVFVLPSSLLLEGCNTTTVAEFVTLIGSDAAALATYFGAGGVAAQLTSDVALIAKDIANWQSGGAAADAIQAINDMVALLGQIPITENYAPLIILIGSALTGLLALLPSPQASIKASVVIAKYKMAPQHYGGFDKKSMTAAKNSLNAQWAMLTATLPVTK
jgi:hypothetical protein